MKVKEEGLEFSGEKRSWENTNLRSGESERVEECKQGWQMPGLSWD